MIAFLIDVNKNRRELPVLLDWEILHSVYDCDAFDITTIYLPELKTALYTASEIVIEHENKRVFIGVIDEYSIKNDQNGSILKVSGRGYAAKLLDNEARAAEYWGVQINYILDHHVYPCGINQVKYYQMGTGERFPISSGESQWKVLREFCVFSGGVEPRFDREGVLILNKEKGEFVDLKSSPISSEYVLDRRYGVFSHVTTINRTAWTESTARNQELINRGGNCHRITNVPRYTSYDAMRHTGEFQLRESKKGSQITKIRLPLLFAAFAGDTVALPNSFVSGSGNFYVTDSLCIANGFSAETELTLVKEG